MDWKSTCMLELSLIGWIWKSTLFWQLISCFELSSCHKKIDFRNLIRDFKSNSKLKISLIDSVWNLALIWQLISCYELSSCHKKILTSEIDWGLANLTVYQKSVWLVEFEILPYYQAPKTKLELSIIPHSSRSASQPTIRTE